MCVSIRRGLHRRATWIEEASQNGLERSTMAINVNKQCSLDSLSLANYNFSDICATEWSKSARFAVNRDNATEPETLLLKRPNQLTHSTGIEIHGQGTMSGLRVSRSIFSCGWRRVVIVCRRWFVSCAVQKFALTSWKSQVFTSGAACKCKVQYFVCVMLK